MFTLAEIAALVNGRLNGDGQTTITGAATIRDAQSGDLTLLDKPKLARELARSAASAVLVADGFVPVGIPFVAVSDVHVAFAKVVTHFRPPRVAARLGVSPAAHVSSTARLGLDVEIHPGAVVGDDVEIGDGCTIHSGVAVMAGCRLGADVTIFPNAVLYEGTVVGPRSLIHAGAVLGAYGFGYHSSEAGHQRCAQLGHVELGADVEIGAGTTVDRGTYGPTTVGDGTKLDNLVMIGHNCRIGRHNLICSMVGIAGSCTTGDHVVIAGQAGMADHVTIGDRAMLGAQSGSMEDVPADAVYLGTPSMPVRDFWRILATWKKLPEIRALTKELEQRLECVEQSERVRPAPPHSEAA